MSLPELTRNAFQSGIPSSQWLELCKLCVEKESVSSIEQVGNAISNSVIALYRSYPAHIGLQDYLRHAIHEGILPISIFVSTFLQAARSPELHHAGTLDMLCRIALDAHYSSGMPPIGSVVSYSESVIVVLGIVQDALALLRTAHSIHMTQSLQLVNSASELVILLLSCVTDMSQVSTAQAMVHFADANDMLQTLRLSPDVRQIMETFVMSLSLLIGDDAKAAREAQMMQSLQLALGKNDILGPNSDNDMVTCGLALHYLVYGRAGDCGAGSETEAVACLLGMLRWSSWTPTVFYTQLLLSALTSVSQCGNDTNAFFLWRAFVIGRLPRLLVVFEKAVEIDGNTETDWHAAMQNALASVLRHSDLIVNCDHVASQAGTLHAGSDYMQEDMDSPRSFTREFLQNLLASGLIDQKFTVAMDPTINNEQLPRLRAEAQEAGTDLETYLDSKLTNDAVSDDGNTFLERIIRDPGSHAAFAEVIRKRFTSLSVSTDVELPSRLSKLLNSHEDALDIVSLHVKMSELLPYALAFLADYDCETVGDPQTAVIHLGDVVLFVQSALVKFQLTRASYKLGDKSISSDWLNESGSVYAIEDLSGERSTAFAAWNKALFDSSSEGIEDTILRSTKPKTLLSISATLFSHAIAARVDKKIDAEVLSNGVSYFTGPLLNWTLVGVVKSLIREIQQKGALASVHLEVLQSLLLSSSCPRPVINLCGPSILRLLSARRVQNINDIGRFDSEGIRRLVLQPSGRGGSLPTQAHGWWNEQPRMALHQTLLAARAGKAPSLNVDRCLSVTTPSKFIELLWSELCAAASLGQMEDCKRLATFVLVVPPRTPNTPRLLPIFMHMVLPSLIARIDLQQPTEQSMSIELVVAVISSVLTAALHLEWAFHTVCGGRHVPPQPAAAMARRLSHELRGKKRSSTGTVVAQKLAASSPFVANFPVFMASDV